MSADSFTVHNEHNNVRDINNAAPYIFSTWGSFNYQMYVEPAEDAAKNIRTDFFDAYHEDPSSAIAEWKDIKAGIDPGQLDLPDLKVIEDTAKASKK